MRHLHFHRDDESTLCGARRWVPFRTGSRVCYARGAVSVHFSKARRSDCAECRIEYRRTIHARRAAAEFWANVGRCNKVGSGEGWVLSEAGEGRGLELQRDDDAGRFSSDDEARGFVWKRAEGGSRLHALALALEEGGES